MQPIWGHCGTACRQISRITRCLGRAIIRLWLRRNMKDSVRKEGEIKAAGTPVVRPQAVTMNGQSLALQHSQIFAHFCRSPKLVLHLHGTESWASRCTGEIDIVITCCVFLLPRSLLLVLTIFLNIVVLLLLLLFLLLLHVLEAQVKEEEDDWEKKFHEEELKMQEAERALAEEQAAGVRNKVKEAALKRQMEQASAREVDNTEDGVAAAWALSLGGR
eukprot:GHVU01167405.1.p1 GENE.GHVU01167405.1~~GHVU01167405.1.p1  ORF type:complete len:218 (+),score=33.54 GHVU01167405.1:2310-2963(+)